MVTLFLFANFKLPIVVCEIDCHTCCWLFNYAHCLSLLSTYVDITHTSSVRYLTAAYRLFFYSSSYTIPELCMHRGMAEVNQATDSLSAFGTAERLCCSKLQKSE